MPADCPGVDVDETILELRRRGITLAAIEADLATKGVRLGRSAISERAQRLGVGPRRGWLAHAPTGDRADTRIDLATCTDASLTAALGALPRRGEARRSGRCLTESPERWPTS